MDIQLSRSRGICATYSENTTCGSRAALPARITRARDFGALAGVTEALPVVVLSDTALPSCFAPVKVVRSHRNPPLAGEIAQPASRSRATRSVDFTLC
jgi:hypothetical protein